MVRGRPGRVSRDGGCRLPRKTLCLRANGGQRLEPSSSTHRIPVLTTPFFKTVPSSCGGSSLPRFFFFIRLVIPPSFRQYSGKGESKARPRSGHGKREAAVKFLPPLVPSSHLPFEFRSPQNDVRSACQQDVHSQSFSSYLAANTEDIIFL